MDGAQQPDSTLIQGARPSSHGETFLWEMGLSPLVHTSALSRGSVDDPAWDLAS